MINGNRFRLAILAAADSLSANRQKIDELNVFPVPDGDTGTNMSMTLSNAVASLSKMSEDAPADEVLKETASCLLRGARGNSGVILSLLFRGISKGVKGHESVSGVLLAAALSKGVESAYKAVMKPTEGTILTVSRVAAECAKKAAEEENKGAVEVFAAAVSGAHDALDKTPELLPVLKKAGVVDSGGAGLCVIFDAMLASFKGEYVSASDVPESTEEKDQSADYHAEITFTYCTEIIVKKPLSDKKDPIGLRAFIESIGDSAVFVDDDEIIKLHVHTDHPGKVLEEGIKYGELMTVKIENMREQNRKLLNEKEAAEEKADVYAAPEKTYGFVSVAAGDGVVSLFEDLGADKVVKGGQTMNPSTDDILKAVEATPAEIVFVLPNNKNIIMAAEQTIPLSKKKICVLPTRSIPMGISAMLAFDEDADLESNITEMRLAADAVGSGLITYAVRDSEYENHNIKAGELMAMKNGKLSFTDTDLTKTVYKLTKSLCKKDSSSVTLIKGKDVNQETAEGVANYLSEKLPELEVTLIDGGQPVYYFIISVEA